MRRKLTLLFAVTLVYLCLTPFAEGDVRREINFPDILGYKTLKCDFHMHTVFSDGVVWPTVRVDEAWREGLDTIAITDHIELQPHEEDIPTNHNRPYEIAASRAKSKNILLIKGAEITRNTPPGHFNAIFLNDIKPLETEDFNDVMKIANQQRAFVFWNHPGWKPETKGWFDIHTKWYENKWFHGIEVANGDTYYPEAHEWCLQKNLTMLGNSDIHSPAADAGISQGQHRTMTLVFAKERTIEALKEALASGRTAVWYKNQLIGREEFLDAIFRASVHVAKPHHRQEENLWVEIRNSSDVDIEMERIGTQGPSRIVLAANATTMLKAKVDNEAGQLKLSYIARNLLIDRDKGLAVAVTIEQTATDKLSIVAPGVKAQRLAGGFKFTEGPAVDSQGNTFFTDIPNSRIHKWSLDGKLSTFLENSGRANGLFFDSDGNLLACTGGRGQLVSIDPQGKVTVIADKYEGKRLNSPNDLWRHTKGGIYFTDPRYGRRDNLPQDGEHVYYLSANHKRLIRVIDDMVRPNGVVGTAEGKLLYVADHGANKTYVYTINPDGTLSDKKLFAMEGSDGMTLDERGNVYLTGKAVSVFDASGKKIETIKVPEKPSNVCFGGKDKKTLFITARTSLYSLRMQVKGL